MNVRLWCLMYNDGKLITAGDNGSVYILDLGIKWQSKQAELAEGQYLWERIVSILSDGGKIVSDAVCIKSFTLVEETDPTVPAWAKASSKPAYTASEVGADVSGTAANAVSSHNTATNAHSDIRTSIDTHTNNKLNPHGVTKSQIGLGNVENKSSATIRSEITSANVTTALGYTPLNSNLKGTVNGVAELDANGKIPSSQLPSYVDDVIEGYLYNSKFYKESAHTTVITGETGKIYIDLSSSKTYRWSGSAFAEISASLALGETSSTAYRGDRGKIAYDHSQAAHAPSDAEKNVQSDWNETNTSSDAFIKNKPTIPTTASDVGAVPTTRKVNNKALSADINLTASDVGAATTNHTHSYNDLTNKPTIPTVNNGTLTIQKNGTTVKTFTANSATNVTANITVPTGAAADKGVDTSISAGSTSTNLPTSKAVAAFVEGKGYKTTDNNTTYTFATGDGNGQIKVTPLGGTAQNVSVKGLGSAAYTASTAYDAAGAASGVQSNLNSHTGNKSNPHGVTAAQVGAATTADITNAINNLDVNAPTASGNTTSFIDSVSQTNGKISATKKTITSASTSAAGIVKLNDAVNSTSTTTAATANAVKKAYDAATSAAADAASRAPATHSHDYIQGGTVGIKASDSNEVSFASNANYIYFGYENRMNSSGIVDTYKFGKHSGVAAAADGNIECGSLVAGRTLKGGTVTVANAATLQYDSTNECLNFVFG